MMPRASFVAVALCAILIGSSASIGAGESSIAGNAAFMVDTLGPSSNAPPSRCTTEPTPGLSHDAPRDVEAGTEPPPPKPPASKTDESTLAALYDAFADLPGFVDVQFIMVGPPRYVALFDGRPPRELPPVDDITQDPVTAERIRAHEESVDPFGLGWALKTSHDEIEHTPCQGLGPGSRFGGCTLGWLVVDPAGNHYITTAGHCVDHIGQEVAEWGRVVFMMQAGIGRDLAVIKVLAHDDEGHSLRSAMCHWGGPQGTANASHLGQVLRQYGHVLGSDQAPALKARSGALYGYGFSSFSYLGPQWLGDSGSPVRLDSGEALGIHTHGAGIFVSLPGIKYGTRIDRGLALAEDFLGIDLHVVDAPIAP